VSAALVIARRSHGLLALATLLSLSTACSDSPQPVEPPIGEQPAPEPQPQPTPPPTGPAAPTTEQIFLATPDGAVTARVVAGSGPAWAPDSRRIAFHRGGEVYVVNADGSNETRLGNGISPSWSPNGASIVFTSREGLSVMNADGSNVRTLLRHDFRDDTYKPWDMGVGKPAWSPDGTQIAFEHLGDGDFQPAQIFVMRADGSNPRVLTTPPNGARYAESDPAWSPDGSSVAHWSYGYGIAVVDGRGGAPNAVFVDFPAVAYGAKPAWSADGRLLSFTRRHWTPRAIWVVSVSGRTVRELIPDGYDAAWSPDGKQIAFVSTRPW
jgi:TolB protein